MSLWQQIGAITGIVLSALLALLSLAGIVTAFASDDLLGAADTEAGGAVFIVGVSVLFGCVLGSFEAFLCCVNRLKRGQRVRSGDMRTLKKLCAFLAMCGCILLTLYFTFGILTALQNASEFLVKWDIFAAVVLGIVFLVLLIVLFLRYIFLGGREVPGEEVT